MSQPIESVAFVGLGNMGWRMAAHLPTALQDARVWNRTTDRALAHAAAFGTRAVGIDEAVQADVIISALPTSAEVEALIAAHPPKAGSVWVDCTSGEPACAARLATELAARGVAFLDAPVSGQTSGAEAGTLTVMVGGDRAALERVRPVLESFGRLIEHVGDSGAGFAVKAVNNMLLAVNLWAAAEGLTALKANGVTLDAALLCINASSGRSMATEMVIPQRVLNRAFPVTFALDLLAKDTRIALSLVHAKQLPAPLLAHTQALYQAALRQLPQPEDFSGVVKLLESWSDVILKGDKAH